MHTTHMHIQCVCVYIAYKYAYTEYAYKPSQKVYFIEIIVQYRYNVNRNARGKLFISKNKFEFD